MIRLVRNLVRYRVAQKTSKGIAKKLGFRLLAPVIGIVSGLRALR